MLMPFSTKIDKKKVKTLKVISKSTHIAQAKLVEEALDMLFEEYKNDVISPEFMKLTRKTINEDKEVLLRLKEL